MVLAGGEDLTSASATPLPPTTFLRAHQAWRERGHLVASKLPALVLPLSRGGERGGAGCGGWTGPAAHTQRTAEPTPSGEGRRAAPRRTSVLGGGCCEALRLLSTVVIASRPLHMRVQIPGAITPH